MDLAARLRSLEDDLRRREGRRDGVQDVIRLEETRAATFAVEAERDQKATEVVQAASEARREELRDRVEALVTRGLRAVFGRDDLEFFFKTAIHRDVFSTTPMVRSAFQGRTIETEIVEGHGGGIADVVSFVLRVIVLCLARPRAAPVLVLDETFRHVSLEYLRGCATLMKELNRSAGIQFVLVTHKPELVDAADVVYRSENVDGRTFFHVEHDLRDDSFHARPPRGASRVDEGTAFGSDLLPPERQEVEPGAVPVVSETADALAIRQRKRAEKPGRPYRPRAPRESTPEEPE